VCSSDLAGLPLAAIAPRFALLAADLPPAAWLAHAMLLSGCLSVAFTEEQPLYSDPLSLSNDPAGSSCTQAGNNNRIPPGFRIIFWRSVSVLDPTSRFPARVWLVRRCLLRADGPGGWGGHHPHACAGIRVLPAESARHQPCHDPLADANSCYSQLPPRAFHRLAARAVG